MSGSERREHPRFDLFAQISIRDGDLDHVMEIVNLSRGGALIDLGRTARPRWLHLEREIDLRLFGDEGKALLQARGTIVRITETMEHRTFAVRFLELVDDGLVREVLRAARRPPPLPTT